ncbi:MAG: glycosyltransferase family 4 protein [Spirochaetes bacterium]|nr:glycosyltransferase family 4 protein [Spirochaetota bacterium]
MNILINIPYFYPATDFGGPVTLGLDLAKNFTKKGHSVSVSTTDLHNQRKRNVCLDEEIDNIKIYRFKNISNYISQKLFLFFSLGYLSKRFKKLVQESDIIYTLNARCINNYILLKLAKKYDKKVVMSPFGGLVRRRNRKYLNKFFDLLFGNFIFKNVSFFFAVNKIEKQSFLSYKQINADKIFIIPNSINPHVFKKHPLNSFRKKYNIAKGRKILLFFSRLYYSKKPLFVIEVFKKICKQFPESLLVMYGKDHGMYSELLAHKKIYNISDEQLLLIPETAGDFKTAVYQDSTMLVLPSPGSEFPLVLLEAMYFNLPVITSDLSLSAFHNKAVKIITMDTNKYQNAIKELFTDTKLYQKYSTLAKKIVIDNFTTEKVSNQILNLFEQFRQQSSN